MTSDRSAPPMPDEGMSDISRTPAENATTSRDTETDPSIFKPFSFAKRPTLSPITEPPSTTSVAYNSGTSRDLPNPTVHPIGEARQKKHLYSLNILTVVIALLCLGVTIVTIAPFSTIPWRLGLKRQLQMVGLILSIMDLCRGIVAPKVYLMNKARYGKSCLQNYEAIPRNTIFLSHTRYVWRTLLLAFIILPTGLSLAYKAFFEASSTVALKNTGGNYGLAAPGTLASAGGTPRGSMIGISAINATLPFIRAAANDSSPSPFA